MIYKNYYQNKWNILLNNNKKILEQKIIINLAIKILKYF
jgi:hypothetical protein